MGLIDEKLIYLSHELRSPITSMLDIIQNMNNSDAATEFRTDLSKLSGIAQNMLENVNEVLKNSRVINCSEEKQFVFRSLFQEIKNVCLPLALAKKQVLNFQINDTKNHVVFANYSKIKCICTNIISNSIKYTGENGHININVCDYLKNDDLFVQITIQDDGIGMDKSLLQKLFYEKYICEDAKRGTGLGMYITKKMVDSINGEIFCESELGIGTTFCLKIPLKYITEYNPEILVGKNLLLVDDDSCITSIYKQYFERMGMIVECWKSLDELKRDDYDIIIVDYHIKTLSEFNNGKQLAKFLHKKYNGKIIMISSNDKCEIFLRGLPTYINDFIKKPLNYLIAEEKIFSLLNK